MIVREGVSGGEYVVCPATATVWRRLRQHKFQQKARQDTRRIVERDFDGTKVNITLTCDSDDVICKRFGAEKLGVHSD